MTKEQELRRSIMQTISDVLVRTKVMSIIKQHCHLKGGHDIRQADWKPCSEWDKEAEDGYLP